jgi:methionyl-tRNA formyltransferase
MNIYIATIDEDMYVNTIVKELINKYQDQIVGLALVPSKRKKQTLFGYYTQLYKMLRFGGVIGYAARILGIRYSEKFAGDNSITKLCARYNIPRIEVGDVNSPEFVKKLKDLKVGILLSFCGQIYREEILSIPGMKIVNKHCALLPHYRGVFPMFWALLNKEKEVGITVHIIDKGIDTGAILAQEKFLVEKGDTMHMLYVKSHKLAAGMMIKVLDYYFENGSFIEFPNLKEEGSYYSFPKPEDVKRFHEEGNKII